jgi:tetratricopeptide (TPR) repeat protein
MDVESIDSGQFETIILDQIAARAHFLVILTHGTLERCQEPNDWLRREIEHAIGLGRNVVPILVNEFYFDGNTRAYLTGPLGELPRYNGLTLPHDYFDAAMERLRTRFLALPAQGVIKPAPPQHALVVQHKIEEVASQPTPTKQELSAEGYFNRGYALKDKSNEQIAYFTEAIRLNPQYAIAYYNRGKAHEEQGDLAGAIADFTEAIRLNPQAALAEFAYTNRGKARRAQGDVAGAIADFTEALRLNPQAALAYFKRGNLHQIQGNIAAAIADYEQYLELGRGIEKGEQEEVEQRICALRAQLASPKKWGNFWR